MQESGVLAPLAWRGLFYIEVWYVLAAWLQCRLCLTMNWSLCAHVSSCVHTITHTDLAQQLRQQLDRAVMTEGLLRCVTCVEQSCLHAHC